MTNNETNDIEKQLDNQLDNQEIIEIKSIESENINSLPKENTYQKLESFFKKNYHLVLSFAFPVAILFISYMAFDVYPAGEKSLLSLDLNAQYIYYYDYMHDVFAGKESLFYSWSRNMSGEMMGIIGYYLASPFLFLLYIFPRHMITEGLLVMMLAKAGACGLAMGLFLDKKRNFKKLTTLIFSIAYALNAFFVVQTMNPMWLDSVIFLPILVWGIEALCEKGKFKLFIFSLVFVFVTNFYIGYMMGFFTILYFAYYMMFKMDGVKGDKYFSYKRVALFTASSGISVLLSAFMILPVYKSLSLGKLDFTKPDYSMVENFNILEIFGKFLPNSYDTVRMEGYPSLYTGMIALLFMIMFVASKKININHKIGALLLISVLFISMYVRPFDMIWHGGQMPNWLPYRYSFMISFLVVIFAAEVFEDIKSITNKMIFGAFGLIVLYALYADTFDSEKLKGTTVLLPAVLIAFVFTLLIYWVKGMELKGSVALALIMVVCIESFYNTYYSLEKMHKDIVYSTKPSYNNVILPTREVVDHIFEIDESFFRIEKNYHRTVNDPMALRLYGMSHSSSTLNEKAIEFLRKMGYTARSHYSRYDGATPLTDDIFGFKYVLAKDDLKHISSDYNKIYSIFDNDNIEINVYENENVLPMLYLASNSVKDVEFSETNPFENQNKLISALIGDGEKYEIFKKMDTSYPITENVTVGTTTDYHDSYKVITEGNNAQIEYKMIAQENAGVYMYLDSIYERRLNVWVNTNWAGNYYKFEDFNIKALGEFNAGDNVDVILTLTEEDLYIRDAQFYYLDKALLDKLVAKIHAKNTETSVERISGRHLKMNVNADESGLIFTTIPAQAGWSVYVDGKKQDYIEIFDETIMAIPVEEGEHEIVLKFFPDGLPLGLAMTFAGIVFLLILLFWDKILVKMKMLDRIAEKGKGVR